MKHAGDEDYLQEAASRALGDEEVLAAGIFGWEDLVWAQIVGGTAAGVGAGVAGGGTAGAIATGIGGYAAKEAMAAAHGMTLELLGVVTASAIRILNWEGDEAGKEILTFDRRTSDVHISRMGLSRIIHLHDTASGAEIKLHATAAPYLPQSKPDKVVLHLLAATT
jgi:hypothetical protein